MATTAAAEGGARRRNTSQNQGSLQAKREDDDPTGYEPPEGVPAGTIFFKYNKFQHNWRVAAMMIPTIAILVVFGGKPTLGCVVGGGLISYLLDFFGWRDSTFVAVWVSIIATMVTIFIASLHLFMVTMFNVALVYNMVICAGGFGIWTTLQFGFFQRQQPRLVLVFERLLFAVVPASMPVIITWAAIAVNGMDVAPYILMVLLGCSFALYVVPVRSSFRVIPKGRSKVNTPDMDELDELVMGGYESAVHTISFALLPAFFKIAIHHTHVVESKDDFADLLILLTLPVLVILSFAHKGSLWWLGISTSTLNSAKKPLIGLCMLVLVGCLEMRVIFHSFANYIKLMPPWDLVVVTAGVYLIAIIVLAHFAGYLEAKGMGIALSILAVAASSCACVALGMPYYIIPFGAAGSFFWVRFYYHKRLYDYLSFVGSLCLVICWFIVKSFMFLDFEFDPLPMSLKHVSMVLMAVVLGSLLVPGLVLVNKNQTVNGVLICLHGVGITVIELQLHCQFKGIYDAYLVIFSSAIGIWLAHFLYKENRLPQIFAWMLGAIYAGKLGLIMHPTPFALPSTMALVFAASPIYMGILFLNKDQALPKPGTMPKSLAVVHMVSNALAMFLTRHTVIRDLVRGTIHTRPTEAFLTGLILVLWPIACSGLAIYHFPSSARLRRAFAMCFCMGATLMVVQPEMEGLGDIFFGRRHHNAKYHYHHTWPAWSFLGAVLSLLMLLSETMRQNWILKSAFSAFAGAGVGLYFAGTFLPWSPVLVLLTALSCGLGSTFLLFVLSANNNKGGFYLQMVYTLFVGLLPVTYMLQPALLHTVKPQHRNEAVQMHRVALLGLYAALSTLIAVVIKLKVSSAETAAPERPRPGMGGVRSKQVLARTVEDSDWMAAIGNVSTCVAFGLATTINVSYLNGKESSIFLLAPLLLLLSQDNGLFKTLTDQHRYFPLVAASVGFLILSACYHLLLRAELEKRHIVSRVAVPRPESSSTMQIAKNLALLLVTVPGHYLFSKFMWTFKHTRDFYWVMLLPINTLPVFLSDLASVRLLGVLGVAAGALQLFLSDRIRKHGLKFV